MRMLRKLRVGDKIFGDDEYHRSAREREKPRLQNAYERGEIKAEERKFRFYDTAERAIGRATEAPSGKF